MAWQHLCSDAKELVLHKLSLRELAYTALVSKEFHQQYVTKASSERARLLADTEATFGGSDFLSRFANELVRPLCGMEPWPTGDVDSEDRTVKAKRSVHNSRAGAALQWSRLFADTRTGMTRRSYSGTLDFFTSIAKTSNQNGHIQEQKVSLTVLKYRRNDVIILLTARRTAVGYALGLLLAICREIRAAVPEAWQRPLTVELEIQRLGEAGLTNWEAKDLIAPLRAEADEFTLYRRGRAHEAMVLPLETGQGRPVRELRLQIA